MATNPVNLVDAIGTVVPRLARDRSGVFRFGLVKTVPATGGIVTVTIGGGDRQCAYVGNVQLLVNDWVVVGVDADRWIVLGKVVPADGMVYGSYIAGSQADTNSYGFNSDRSIDGAGVRASFLASNLAANGAAISVAVNGVAKTSLSLGLDCQLNVVDNTVTPAVYRPIPWAIEINFATLPINGKTSATVAVTYTAGRFTLGPIGTATLYTASASAATAYGVRMYSGGRTGMTFAVNTTTAATTDFLVEYVVYQATRTTAAGLREAMPRSDDDMPVHLVTLTCATPGCVNYGIPIEMEVPVEVDSIQCGPCRREITDVATERGR